MENNNSFTLKDVIFNLLFIILFVCILIWLFPTKSFLNNNGIYNSSETETSQIFNHNIATMKEATISYFTTSRLPKSVGDTVKITLSEMVNKKLLLSLIDSKGNVCDETLSYVEMTKEKDEYILKVNLSCSDNEDYILVHLGCYDYCEGDVCEKEEPTEILYKYQYKLEIPCKLTDWSNWSEWSTNYIVANSNRKVETKYETETINTTVKKYCQEGYLYSAYTNKCYKSNNTTDIKDATKKIIYKCQDGYTLDETDNKCKKQTTTTVTELAKENKTTYNCNDYPGYTLKGSSCVKDITNVDTITVDATPVYDVRTDTRTVSYSCKKETCSTKLVPTLVGGVWKNIPQKSCKYVNSTCYKEEEYNESYISGYTCSEGYTLNGTKCEKKVTTQTTDTKSAKANPTTYYCENSEYTLEGKVCKHNVTTIDVEEPDVQTSYTCTNLEGYVINKNKCEKIVTNTDTLDVIEELSCPSGYTLKDNKCMRAIIKYRYSERSCVGGSIDYKWSENDNDEDLLKQGYVLTGYKEQINSK